MLGDLKIVFDIVCKGFGIRTSEQEKTVRLLHELSRELDELADGWNQILQGLEKNPNQYPFELADSAYLRQRRNFSTLYRFMEVLNEKSQKSNNKVRKIEPFLKTIAGALDEKGELFCLVKRLVYPNRYIAEYPERVWFENPWLNQINEIDQIKNIDINDSQLSESDRVYYRFLKRTVERQEKDEEFIREKAFRENVAREILPEFRDRVTKLVDIASDFRSQLISFEYFE
jgi:hypothetical protein